MIEQKRPWYRRGWFLLLSVFVALGFGIWCWNWFREWQIQQELASLIGELDQAEPGWRFEDWIRMRNVPEEENLAEAAWQLRKKMTPEPANFYPLFEETEFTPHHQLDKEQIKALKAILANAGDLSTEAQRLLLLKHGQFPAPDIDAPAFQIWSVNLEPQQSLRSVVQFFGHAARLAAQQGNGDQALLMCRTMLHLAHAYDQEPFLISHLIAIAIQNQAAVTIERVLAQSEPSEAALRETQAVLLREASQSFFEQGIRGERACCDRTLREIAEGRYSRKEMLAFFSPPAVSGSPWEGLLAQMRLWVKGSTFKSIPEERLNAHRFYRELLEAMRQPGDQQMDRIKNIVRQGALRGGAIAALGPAVEKVHEADVKRRAMLRMTAALLAAERFRRAQGQLPGNWQELLPLYGQAIPTDPYDDQPVRWKKTDTGFVLYSVWMNRKDDGGAIRAEGINTPAPADFGVEFWDVQKRRQAPVTRKEEGAGLQVPGR